MGIRLSESAIRLIDGRNYAVLATVNADGSPQTSVMWVGRRFNTVLSWKYDGNDPGQDRPGAVRVVVRVEVRKAAGPAA
jgi:hypothetical protein